MLYDPSNPVVQLCAQGIETEYGGDIDKAGALYRQAWERANCPLEWSTAAHYLARVQTDPAESLRWNMLALEQAGLVGGEEVGAVYPSLELNVAHAYEKLGDREKALEHYRLAERAAETGLPTDGYGEMIRKGIGAGLERMIKAHAER
jgi:tetratricopeptide (TPR) repeat protein